MRVWSGLGARILRFLYRFEVCEAHRVPSAGPVVFVSNHVGFLDGPVAFIAIPRPAHFLVKRSWFSGPFGALLHGCGQIPITQNHGDREAQQAARRILGEGGAVGVFPEGTRGDGDVSVAQQGAAYLALSAQAQVVPVALTGTAGRTKSSWPRLRSRMRVTFGAPFTVHDLPQCVGLTRRAALEQATEYLRAALAAHVAKHR